MRALVLAAALACAWPAAAQNLQKDAEAAYARGDYAAAETLAQRLVDDNRRRFGPDHQNVGTARNLLGAVYLRQGKFSEAEAQFRAVLAIYEKRLGPEHEYTAAALNSLALVRERLGDYQGAETLLRRALAILEKKLGKNHPDTAVITSNLARVLDSQGKSVAAGGDAAQLANRADAALKRGEYQQAETLQHQVVAIHDKTLGREHPTTATSLSNLGIVLSLQGKYAEAEAVHRRALAIREKVLGPNHPDVATSLNNLANVLQELGKDQQLAVSEARARARAGGLVGASTEVEQMYRRALAIQDRALGREHPSTATTLNNLGVMLSLRGDYAQAEGMHRAALGTMEKVYGEQHPDTAAVLTALSLSLDRQGKVQDAEAAYRRAVEISRNSGNPRNLLINASRLGFSLAKRGRYGEALPYYEEAVDTLDFLYSQTRGYSEETRQAFLQQFSAIYRETIRLRLLLHRAQPAAGHDRAALALASRNQSRVFSEMLRQADVARFSTDPAFIKEREGRERLQERLAQLRQARAAVPVTAADARARAAELDAQIGQAASELAAADQRLWRDYPRFMELTTPRPVTVEDLQQKLLRPDEVLLSYVLLPQETVIFAVTRERFRMAVTATRRADLAERVLRIRRNVDKIGAGESVLFLRDIEPELLHGLHRDLVAPVAEMLAGRQKVLVVADGPLQTLPFEMMVTAYQPALRAQFMAARSASDGSAARPYLAEYAMLPYLGRELRFAYLPSLAALASQRLYPKRAAAARAELVAFADPQFPPGVPRLAETADEAREIGALLGGRQRLYIGAEAQERAAKGGELKSARFVLFATHGYLGGQYLAGDQPAGESEMSSDAARRAGVRPGAQPALALTQVGDLRGEDGLLTMREVIDDLELDADLVALSACNTAGESVQASNGEGFAGLTRAFMYAGARSLLVSHWAVDSPSTQALMTGTFKGIRAGHAPIVAVSDAQRELVGGRYASGPYQFSRAHPFFWAPFVYVGE